MSTTCPVCVRLVLDVDEGVCCDAECERWFHRECVRMLKAEYQRLSSDSNLKWRCTRTDCKKSSANPVDEKLDAILSKLSSLATKTELSEGLNTIKEDLKLVTTKLNELEPRLAKVELEVNKMKDGHTVNDLMCEDVISECNDRSRRSRNVIVHNLAEANPASPAREAKTHDARHIQSFLDHIHCNVQFTDVRHFRLGKRSRDKIRPLVICLPSESAALYIFKNFKHDDVPDNLRGISVSHDRTPRERKHLEQLRASLKSRQDAGEVNLTIKYINGSPKIVQKNV